MSDLISKQDAIEAVEYNSSGMDRRASIKAIKALPSADRLQGEWIDKGWKGDWQFETDGRGNCWHEYECSECGFYNKGSKSNFCPNCGAKMEGGDTE